MFEQLTRFESDALEMFCLVAPTLRWQLETILSTTKIHREDLGSSYFLDFRTERKCTPGTSVPITVIVDPERSEGIQIDHTNGATPIHTSINSTVFLLHFVGEAIVELEVYNVAGNQLDYEVACKGGRIYLIRTEN